MREAIGKTGLTSDNVVTTFDIRQQQADGAKLDEMLAVLIQQQFPGATGCYRAGEEDDKRGVDFWVTFGGSMRDSIGVDVKVRNTDPVEKFGKDDLALEIWSNVEREKVGWTRDRKKITDYVMWYFVPTGRVVLLPFPMLLRAMETHWEKWSERYRVTKQRTRAGDRSWESCVVLVPTVDIFRAFYGFGKVK